LAEVPGPGLTFRFVAGPDVDALDVARAEILAAVEGAVRAQGEGQVVLEPRVHLVPPNGGAGHFNVLRGHLGPERVSGV
jgi:alanine dehydrogenase